MLKNNENIDFLQENARFLPLIKHYAKKLNNGTAELDLIEFLYFLYCRQEQIPSDKYIFTCLKNEFLRLLKIEKKLQIFTPFLYEMGDKINDLDLKFDIKKSLTILTEKEKKVIILHYYLGYSIKEIAESIKISRQRVNRIKNMALEKLRDLVKLN